VATKRVSHQEIDVHPDTGRERAEEWITKYWRHALGLFAVVCLGLIGFQIMKGNSAKAEREAHGLWIRAQKDVTEAKYASALELANQIRDRHPNTPSGKRALIVRADALLGSGDLTGARAAYEDATAKVDDPILQTSAKRGLAVLLEESGDAGSAATIYRDLGDTAEPSGGRVFDLASAARTYAAAGQHAEAISALETLISTHESASERAVIDQVHLARVHMEELRAASAF
jgi:predicted negative regulator of RcsB-dependent stress response